MKITSCTEAGAGRPCSDAQNDMERNELPLKKKMTFALCFGNRGFMPGELILGAREDMVKAVTDAGYDYIMM